MGTIGMPAAIAMRKAPFLNGNSSRPWARVPSGAMTMEMPSRANPITDFIDSTAFFVSERSMKATFIRRPTGPMMGCISSSFFATPV